MTIKSILGHVGDKVHERLHHGQQNQYYGTPMGYNYNPYHMPPPPPPGPPVFKHYSFSHSSNSGGYKASGAAMSALTLLSFLFFLNILQQCLKDQMMTDIYPTVAVMQASKQEVEINREIPDMKEDKTMMLRIQPIEKSKLGHGVGRAYPTELSEVDTEALESSIKYL